ncbi:MAG: PRC-barrel domain-containing protein [Pseudomonadota bacterium]
MKKRLSTATLGMVLGLVLATGAQAQAQTPDVPTLGVTVDNIDQISLGLSARKNILGKPVYNEAGEKVGRVSDLIVDPASNASYLIVAAGGFVGLGSHTIVFSTTQIRQQGDKLILPGATKAVVRAMAPFEYATGAVRRSRLVAQAQHALDKAGTRVADLRKKASATEGEDKLRLERQIERVTQAQHAVQDKLTEMQVAGMARWKQFEVDINQATNRLRRSLEDATG